MNILCESESDNLEFCSERWNNISITWRGFGALNTIHHTECDLTLELYWSRQTLATVRWMLITSILSTWYMQQVSRQSSQYNLWPRKQRRRSLSIGSWILVMLESCECEQIKLVLWHRLVNHGGINGKMKNVPSYRGSNGVLTD